MPRALLYLHRASNLSHAIPLLHVLRRSPGWEVAMAASVWDREAGTGLPPVYLERLHRLGAPVVAHPSRFRGDVFFSFDAVEGWFEKVGLKVRLPGSLAAKGVRYAGGRSAERDNLADLILVPGPWHQRRMFDSSRIFVPVHPVGLPSLDPLFGDWVASRKLLRQQLTIKPGQKVVLYAPTWNPELSSAPLLWTRVRELAGRECVLILRPHPQLPVDCQHACERLAAEHPHVRLAREPDLQPYLRVADLVVSDTSSVAWEAAALDRPVIRVATPNRSEYPDFDPGDPENQFTDIGPLVRELDELKAAVAHALAHPKHCREQRLRARDALLACHDGTTCAQIVRVVEELLAGKPVGWHAGRTAPVTVILSRVDQGGDAVERTLNALFEQGGEACTVKLLDETGLSADRMMEWSARWPNRVERIADRRNLTAAAGILLLLQAGVTGSPGWLFLLMNHFRRDPSLAAVTPLGIGGRPAQDPSVRMQQHFASGTSTSQLDRELKLRHAGELLSHTQVPAADCVLLRAGPPNANDLLARWIMNRWPSPDEPYEIPVAADVVLEFNHPSWLDTAPDQPLSEAERNEAEERVRNLAAWIQRAMPAAVREPLPASGIAPVGNGNDLPGPLRLARHYLEQNKPERAKDLLQRALHDLPDHPLTKALAIKVGLIANSHTLHGAEAGR